MNILYTAKHTAKLISIDNAAREKIALAGEKTGKMSKGTRGILTTRMKDIAKGLGCIIRSRTRLKHKDFFVDRVYVENEAVYIYIKLFGEEKKFLVEKVAEASPRRKEDTQQMVKATLAKYKCICVSGLCSQYIQDCIKDAVKFYIHENPESVFLKTQL